MVHIFESNLPQNKNLGISEDINLYKSTAGPMSLNASKLDGINQEEATVSTSDHMAELLQRKKDIEQDKKQEPSYDKQILN